MPVGALIGAAGAVGGALITGNATQSAAKDASSAAAANNALQAQIYASNTKNLQPFMDRGNAAGDELNSLLGLGGGSGSSSGSSASTTGTYDGTTYNYGDTGEWNAYLAAHPDVAAMAQHVTQTGQFASPDAYAAYHYATYGGPGTQYTATPTVSAPSASGGSGNSGLDTYLNSTDYNFTTQQGLNQLEASQSAGGMLHSGAALKAISNYGQNTAQSALGSYLNYLTGQQQTGLSGANALAGVGTGYANAVSSNNNSAASAAGNAALAGAGQVNGALSGLGSSYALYQGLQGSSYGAGALAGQSGGASAGGWTAVQPQGY